jgi:hypothetical protein
VEVVALVEEVVAMNHNSHFPESEVGAHQQPDSNIRSNHQVILIDIIGIEIGTMIAIETEITIIMLFT